MSYNYQEQKAKLDTAEGRDILLKVRDNALKLLEKSGAFQASFAWCTGDTWIMMAVLDYMVERGELVELSKAGTWAQYRVFTAPFKA